MNIYLCRNFPLRNSATYAKFCLFQTEETVRVEFDLAIVMLNFKFRHMICVNIVEIDN